MQHDRTGLAPILLAFAGLAACIAFGEPDRREGEAPTPARPERTAEKGLRIPPPPEAAPADLRRRVVLVTVDGWHVKLAERMPTWKAMAAEGSWTFSALVPKGATTAISHGELYTGAEPSVNGVTREPDKRIENDPHVHGVKFRWTPLKVSGTIFTAVEDAGHEALAVVQKGKLVGMLRPDGGQKGVHVYGDAKLVKAACAAVKDDAKRLVVLHIGMPDGAGHRHGWLSDEYYATAGKVDAHLAAIRGCIADAEKAGGVPTTLIVTSDHGGTPVDACMAKRGKAQCGHGADDADNRRVPWVAVGHGIRKGHEIRGQVRLADTAPTILRLLGIPASSLPSMTGTELSEIFLRP